MNGERCASVNGMTEEVERASVNREAFDDSTGSAKGRKETKIIILILMEDTEEEIGSYRELKCIT